MNGLQSLATGERGCVLSVLRPFLPCIVLKVDSLQRTRLFAFACMQLNPALPAPTFAGNALALGLGPNAATNTFTQGTSGGAVPLTFLNLPSLSG